MDVMDKHLKSTVNVSTQTARHQRSYYPRELKIAVAQEVRRGIPARRVAEKFNLQNVQVVYNMLYWCREEGYHGLTVQRLADYLNSGRSKSHIADYELKKNAKSFQNSNERVWAEVNSSIPRATDNLRSLSSGKLMGGLRLNPEQAAKLKQFIEEN
jgi:hypothetical protein